MPDANSESSPRQFPSRRHRNLAMPSEERSAQVGRNQDDGDKVPQNQSVETTADLLSSPEDHPGGHLRIPSRRSRSHSLPEQIPPLSGVETKLKSSSLPVRFSLPISKRSIIIVLILVLALVLSIVGGLWLRASKNSAIEAEPDPFTVTGRHGATLTLQINQEITEKAVGTQILEPGSGRTVGADEPVFARVTNFSASSGEPKNLHPIERIGLANTDLLPGLLYPSVIGKHEGDRIAVVHNIGRDEAPELEISIIDIMYTVANGDLVPQPETKTIWVDDSGEVPTIIKGDSLDLSKSLSEVVVKGKGAQIGPDETLLVQYAVMNALTGEITDTTWEDKMPRKVRMSEMMKPLSNDLTDQMVGSRLVVLVPAAEADGNLPVIIMVDIIGIIPTEKQE